MSSGLGRWRVPLVGAILLVGAVLRVGACHHHVGIDFDEGRYLDNAANLIRGRGLASSYTSHFFREAAPRHPEEISSPLFPLLLAGSLRALPEDGPDPHRVAQAWSVAPGTLAILLTFLLGRRLFDERAALVGALLVALNPDMIILSSWGMTESLYMAGLLAILLGADRAEARAVRWGWLGAACGLLYLLRANGLAAAAGLGAARLAGRGSAGARLRGAAVLGVCFLAVVSPWLVRNARAFRSPTHTAMKQVAWTESGRDLFTWGVEPPSMSRYLEAHGPAGLAIHLVGRGARAGWALVWGDTGGYRLLGLVFPLCALMSWNDPRVRAGHLCVLFSTLLLLGVPTWTGALSRYTLPLRPWIYLTALGVILRHASPRKAAVVATGAALLVGLSLGPLRAYAAADERPDDAAAREAARWIAERTPDGAVLMEGAWLHQYAHLFDRPVVWAPAGGIGTLLEAADRLGADYLVVSAPLLRYRPELKGAFEVDARGAVSPDTVPAGFSEVFAGAGRRIVIYRMPVGAG